MPVGLLVWNDDGTVQFDGTTSLSRTIGSVSTSAAQPVVVPEFSNGRPWAFFRPNDPPQFPTYFDVNSNPVITITGQNLTWAYGNGIPIPGTIVYGVY